MTALGLTMLELLNLGLLVLFLPPFVLALSRHARGESGPSLIIGGSRLAGSVGGVGTILVIFSATLPVTKWVVDLLGIAGCGLWLGGMMLSRREGVGDVSKEAV
jgi:hypothetical protein